LHYYAQIHEHQVFKSVIYGAEHCKYSTHIANETLGKFGLRWEGNTSMDLYDIRWVDWQ